MVATHHQDQPTAASHLVADVDQDPPGEIGRSFSFRALTGESLQLATATDVTRVAWSASVQFMLDGAPHGFQAGPRGLGSPLAFASASPEGAVPFEYSVELETPDGRGRIGERRVNLSTLSDADRRYLEQTGATSAAGSTWIGLLEVGDYDLLSFGSDWAKAEAQYLHQMNAFTVRPHSDGVSIQPRVPGVSVYASVIGTYVSPIGSLSIVSSREAGGLVPSASGLETTHGTLHRVVHTVEGEELHHLVFVGGGAVAVIDDRRFDDLDQADRLDAIQDLRLDWE